MHLHWKTKRSRSELKTCKSRNYLKEAKNEQCIREGMADLQQKGQNIKICIEDYRIYTYWLRETEIRNHMEQILRAAISAAKASNDKIKHDKLMKMGSMWKSHPNLASWHDTDEPTEGIHNCFPQKLTKKTITKTVGEQWTSTQEQE